MDVDELRHREVDRQPFELLFFFEPRPLRNGKIGTSCLSQWWAAPFEVGGERYATAEHYVMVGKARLFGDDAIATHILQSTAPEEAIELGREVRGFEQSAWLAARYGIVVAANRVGVERSRRFIGRSQIVAPSGEIIVEAGPTQETTLYAELDLTQARQKRIVIEPGELVVVARSIVAMLTTEVPIRSAASEVDGVPSNQLPAVSHLALPAIHLLVVSTA